MNVLACTIYQTNKNVSKLLRKCSILSWWAFNRWITRLVRIYYYQWNACRNILEQIPSYAFYWRNKPVLILYGTEYKLLKHWCIHWCVCGWERSNSMWSFKTSGFFFDHLAGSPQKVLWPLAWCVITGSLFISFPTPV